MLEIVILVFWCPFWCGLFPYRVLLHRTKRVTKDPDKRIDLPFKSRILETDRIEKDHDPSDYKRIRVPILLGFIPSLVIGFVLRDLIFGFSLGLQSKKLNQINPGLILGFVISILFILLPYILSAIGALIGGAIGYSSLKKAKGDI